MAHAAGNGRRWSWPGRVVIVTGASSGIGAALAEDLGKRGATVVGVARRRDQLEAVMARAGSRSRAVVADLAEEGAAEDLVATTESELDRIDVLVNNAAIPMRVHATRLTSDHVRRAMEVNFLTAVRATLASLPGMLARGGGHVVNVSSVGGRIVSPREAGYVASKFALVGWTEAMAADLTGTGVRMHLMYPGPIDTEIWDKLDEPASYSGRFYSPQRVSAAIMRMVERDRFEAWVPRRMSALVFVRAALPRLFVESAGRFDRRAESRR